MTGCLFIKQTLARAAKLMRFLFDRAGLGWDEAWGHHGPPLAYADDTLLPELLEEWPPELFDAPRMANLAIVGTHSTDSVPTPNSEPLWTKTMADFAARFPELSTS